jgi:hypothetical protein
MLIGMSKRAEIHEIQNAAFGYTTFGSQSFSKQSLIICLPTGTQVQHK